MSSLYSLSMGPKRRWGKENIVFAAFLMLSGVCTVHFLITAIYVTPQSPARLHLDRVVRTYAEPFFYQRWELFAPDPLIGANSLLIQCRIAEADGAVQDSGWYDVTTPLLMRRQHRRVGWEDRMFRAKMNLLTMLMPKPNPLVTSITSLDTNLDPALDQAALVVKSSLERQKQTGLRVLARAGSVDCERLFPGKRITQVHLRVRFQKSRPFSQRMIPGYQDTGILDLGSHPFESVTQPG